jgi:hypothetical protein
MGYIEATKRVRGFESNVPLRKLRQVFTNSGKMRRNSELQVNTAVG